MAKPPDIIEFIKDPRYLGPDDQLSISQEAFLRALYGLPLNAEMMDAHLEATGGVKPRKGGHREGCVIAGRRSGKTDKILANMAVYEGFVFDPSFLQPGEDAFYPIVAQNVDGAGRARGYIEGKLLRLAERDWPVFEEGTAQERAITGKQIRCRKTGRDGRMHRLIYQCFPCTKAAVRGITAIGWGVDEIGFWQTEEGAYNADVEVIRALAATVLTAGKWAKGLIVSTPYAEEGVLWDCYEKRRTSHRLVVQVPTWIFNPHVDTELLEEKQNDDPVAYQREYGAQFGKAGGSYLSIDEVEKALDANRPDIVPPQPGFEYAGALDVAFKQDLYVWGIGHEENSRLVVDLLGIRQGSRKAPLDGAECAALASEDFKAYKVDRPIADQYSDVQVVKDFDACGVQVAIHAQTDESNFEMFKNLKAAMRRQLVNLPDLPIVKKDLLSLRTYKKARAFRVAAPDKKGFHDDISKVVAVLLMKLLPMAQRGDLEAANASAIKDRTRLFKERGFRLPRGEERDGLPTNFMEETF